MAWEQRRDRIVHDGPDLLWEQVANDLRADIESGVLPANAKLPSALDLAEIYGVARVTILSAIAQLEREGLVRKTTGRGTFVTRRG